MICKYCHKETGNGTVCRYCKAAVPVAKTEKVKKDKGAEDNGESD